MSEETRKPTTTITWIDRRGHEQVRIVKHVIDVRDYLGTPGYSLLFAAANTHLSVHDIWDYLCDVAEQLPFVERTESWIQKRRWLFQQPETKNPRCRPNGDGQDDRAAKIMRANPALSVRNLTALLREKGITRGREWVRRRRCS